jgi:hypothetical protein
MQTDHVRRSSLATLPILGLGRGSGTLARQSSTTSIGRP